MKTTIKSIFKNIGQPFTGGKRKRLLESYIRNGRKPWSEGYYEFREDYIKQQLSDAAVIDLFRTQSALPASYAEFLDERTVEYPWLISRMNPGAGNLLDAGSALNYSFMLEHPVLTSKRIILFTLSQEPNHFLRENITYQYGDLRSMPFPDNFFKEVTCISTLEHVGMDNTLYARDLKYKEHHERDFGIALQEMKRVVKPGGKVYVTVPYGKYTDFGWYQQFDEVLLQKLIADFAPSKLTETFFYYESGGWNFSSKEKAGNAEGFDMQSTRYYNDKSTKDYDPDFAAGSRGIAALELWK